MFIRAFLWSFIFCLWYIQDTYTYNFHFTYVNGTEIDNLSEYCNSNECVVKCCPENHIILYGNGTRVCTPSFKLIEQFGVKDPDNYSDIKVYHKDIQQIGTKVKKTANQMKFIYDTSFYNNSIKLGSHPNTYLLEDGKFIFYHANIWQPLEPRQFCIEHQVYLSGNLGTLVSVTPSVVVCKPRTSDGESPSNGPEMLTVYGLLVSCVFFLLVLAVYALLTELRNLAGLTLMACMATYFAFFFTKVLLVFLTVHGIISEIPNACQILNIEKKGGHYFGRIDRGTYNILLLDVSNFLLDECCLLISGGLLGANLYSKYSQMWKFRRYCAYAWGLPVLPTLFVVITDLSDLTSLPGFVKLNLWDNACKIEPVAHLLYLNVPIFILICVNLILFLMTAFNISQVKRGVRDISQDIKRNKKNENGFWLYFRLSLLMGVSWILEVIRNVVDTKSLAWYIADYYNALIGLFIFLTFICKKKIFLRLYIRFSIDNQLMRYVRRQADETFAPDAPAKTFSQLNDISITDGNGPTPSCKGITLSEDI